jgi:hypothetical protein
MLAKMKIRVMTKACSWHRDQKNKLQKLKKRMTRNTNNLKGTRNLMTTSK